MTRSSLGRGAFVPADPSLPTNSGYDHITAPAEGCVISDMGCLAAAKLSATRECGR